MTTEKFTKLQSQHKKQNLRYEKLIEYLSSKLNQNPSKEDFKDALDFIADLHEFNNVYFQRIELMQEEIMIKS